MDAGNLLKPMLGRGELRCIGATTLDEYRKYIEKDPALERRFQQVYVDQPSVENTISILRGLRQRYELHHAVRISDSALVEAAVLSDRYISDRFLPDKGLSSVNLQSFAIPHSCLPGEPALKATAMHFISEHAFVTFNSRIGVLPRVVVVQRLTWWMKRRQS